MLVVVGAGGGGAPILIHAIEKPQTCILWLEEKQSIFISIKSFQVFMVLEVPYEQRHNIHQNINELLPQYSFF